MAALAGSLVALSVVLLGATADLRLTPPVPRGSWPTELLVTMLVLGGARAWIGLAARRQSAEAR